MRDDKQKKKKPYRASSDDGFSSPKRRHEEVPPGRIDRRLPPKELFDYDTKTEYDYAGENSYYEEENPDPYNLAGKAGRAGKPKKQRGFPRRKPKRDEPPQSRLRRVLMRILQLACISFALLFIAGAIFLLYTTRHDGLWLDLDQIPYKTETIIYSTNPQTGEVQEYARLPCTQNKIYVEGSRMPQQLKNAFVAIEDQNFYTHNGVSLKRTLYAAVNEVKYALTGSYIGGDTGRKQGASTIDQQLIKNLTRDDEDSNMAGYLRKLREIYRAYRLDVNYGKDTILEAYLNTISFTGNTAGVGAEARKLFGKEVEELTLAECASLAAITRNPSRYSPVTNPDEHIQRRNYVLYEMLQQGHIDDDEYQAAIAEPLALNYSGEPVRESEVTSYFTDALMDEVIKEFQLEKGLSRKEATNLLYNGGLRIYATVAPQLQNSMENAMASGGVYPQPLTTVTVPLRDEAGNPLLDEGGNPMYGQEQVGPQAAMVSLDYNGGVCAIVGGLGEKEISRGFNRATSAVRQVGSTMKAISPYVVALENDKITWSTPFLDAPVKQLENEYTGEKEDWPSNVTNYYTEKDILVREAFSQSVNTVAVRVGEKAGTFSMYRFTRYTLGIETLTGKDRALGPMVLGSSTYGITPIDMAKAYAMFGNGGQLPTVHTFTAVKNGSGGVLLEKKIENKQVISEETAYIMNRLMREVVTNGTAAGMAVPGEMDSVGKTGTTSDNRDHWFIGLTPYYVTASWYGYDNNTTLNVNSRSHPPTLAWRWVMQQGQAGLPYAEFSYPGTVEEYKYCTVSGYAAGPNCPSATGYYKEDEPPKAGCPVHG